jgi:hypothetical protein
MDVHLIFVEQQHLDGYKKWWQAKAIPHLLGTKIKTKLPQIWLILWP